MRGHGAPGNRCVVSFWRDVKRSHVHFHQGPWHRRASRWRWTTRRIAGWLPEAGEEKPQYVKRTTPRAEPLCQSAGVPHWVAAVAATWWRWASWARTTTTVWGTMFTTRVGWTRSSWAIVVAAAPLGLLGPPAAVSECGRASTCATAWSRWQVGLAGRLGRTRPHSVRRLAAAHAPPLGSQPAFPHREQRHPCASGGKA